MVLSMERWVGKVAVVTGASSGIGAAIAEALVEQGLIVAGLARRKERVEALSQKLSKKKGKLYAIKVDASKEEDILSAFKWIKENLGPVYILVNNAGVADHSAISEGTTESWRRVIDLNVIGLSIATREAIRDMKANKVDGHIIHINSVLGHQIIHFASLGIYGASKFAVTALTETLRLELMNQKSKIKITSISPGPVDTEMIPEEYRKIDFIKQAFSNKEFIEPDNIADAVVYALSTPPHVQIQELTVRSVTEIKL